MTAPIGGLSPPYFSDCAAFADDVAYGIMLVDNEALSDGRNSYYNFVRPHKTLANTYLRTPAMAAGLANHIWTVEEIVTLFA